MAQDDRELLEARLETGRQQLELLEHLSDLQRETLELARQQYARAEAINDRAEALQARQAQLLQLGRRASFVILPVVALLIAVVVFLLARLGLV